MRRKRNDNSTAPKSPTKRKSEATAEEKKKSEEIDVNIVKEKKKSANEIQRETLVSLDKVKRRKLQGSDEKEESASAEMNLSEKFKKKNSVTKNEDNKPVVTSLIKKPKSAFEMQREAMEEMDKNRKVTISRNQPQKAKTSAQSPRKKDFNKKKQKNASEVSVEKEIDETPDSDTREAPTSKTKDPQKKDKIEDKRQAVESLKSKKKKQRKSNSNTPVAKNPNYKALDMQAGDTSKGMQDEDDIEAVDNTDQADASEMDEITVKRYNDL